MTTLENSQPVVDDQSQTAPSHTRADVWKRRLSPANISIVYLYIASFILFSIWIPHLWLSWVTVRSVVNISFAIPAIVAVGLVVPLLAGVYDLSIGGVMSASAITVSWLLVNHHWNMWAAMLVAVLVAMAAGLLNGVLVVGVGVNSFIATLGTSAVLAAYAEWRSGGIQITGFSNSFQKVGNGVLFSGIQIKVLYLVVIAMAIWYVIEHTPAGRYIQASGDNEDAARLAGVQTRRYIFASLMVSATVAGFAGIVQTATIGAGNSDVGSPFLLAAFAAAFLGSTQFKRRFNVLGTLAAVWVLDFGVQGVTLAVGSYSWLNDLFFGVALILAVGLSKMLDRWQAASSARQRSLAASLAMAMPRRPGARMDNVTPPPTAE